MYWVGALFIGNAVYICMCSCVEQVYGTIISLFSSLSSLSLSTAQTNTSKSFDLPWLKHNFFHLPFFLFCLLSYVILYISKRFKWFSFYRLWIDFLLHSSGFFVFLIFYVVFIDLLSIVCLWCVLICLSQCVRFNWREWFVPKVSSTFIECWMCYWIDIEPISRI